MATRFAVNYTRALQRFSTPVLKTGLYLNFNTDASRDNQTDIDIVMDAVALPTQLYPGFHLFGTTFYSFRDTYASSRDFAFGIPHVRGHLTFFPIARLLIYWRGSLIGV
jgi:hypothetical protein